MTNREHSPGRRGAAPRGCAFRTIRTICRLVMLAVVSSSVVHAQDDFMPFAQDDPPAGWEPPTLPITQPCWPDCPFGDGGPSIDWNSVDWRNPPIVDNVIQDPFNRPPEGVVYDAVAGASEPINLSSGEFYREETDLSVPGRGLHFKWERTYAAVTGPLDAAAPIGNRWDHNFNIWLERSGDDLVLHDGHGQTHTYIQDLDQTGKWTRRGSYDVISYDYALGECVRTYPDGVTEHFYDIYGSSSSMSGRLLRIADTNGNTMYLEWDGGKLVSITDPLDRVYTLGYVGSQLVSLTDFSGRSVTYAYYTSSETGGASGDLKSVTTPAITGTVNGNDYPSGKTTVYTYTRGSSTNSLNHAMLSIRDPSGAEYLRNTFEVAADGLGGWYQRVSRQFFGTGDFKYTYVEDLDPEALNGATHKTIVNDRMGNVQEQFFDSANRLVIVRDYTGRADPSIPTTDTDNRPSGKLRASDPTYFETHFGYNSDHRLVWQTQTQTGVKEEWDYNESVPFGESHDVLSRGDLLNHRITAGTILGPVSDQASATESWIYESAHHRATNYKDPRGNTTALQYFTAGNLKRIDYPLVTHGVLGGGTQAAWEAFEYDEYGDMTVHRWASNRRDEFEYYGWEDLVHRGYLKAHTVDALGVARRTSYTYTSIGDLASETDPAGHLTTFAHNALHQRIQTIWPAAQSGYTPAEERRNYDVNDNLAQVDTRNIGVDGTVQANEWWTTTRTYGVLNRLMGVTEEVDSGHAVTTAYQYDANGNQTLVQHPECVNGHDPTNEESSTFDERDLLFHHTTAVGGVDQSTKELAYDGRELLTSCTEGLELPAPFRRTTTYAADAYGRTVKTTDAEGNVAVVHFDADGNAVSRDLNGELLEGSAGSSAGNVLVSHVETSFDERNRGYETRTLHRDLLTGAAIGDGWRTENAFWTTSSLAQATQDDNGHGSYKVYNGAEDLSFEQDSAGNSREYHYDSAGYLASVTHTDIAGSGASPTVHTTTYANDARGRLTGLTLEGMLFATYGYDGRGNRALTIDGRGNDVTKHFDGLGRVTSVSRSVHAGGIGTGAVLATVTTSTSWDDSSHVHQEVDDNGNITTHYYDGAGRETSVVFADGTSSSKAFDALGNITTGVDPNGSVSTLTYDLLGRVRMKSISRASGVLGTTWETFEYDGASNIRWAKDDDTEVERRYDSLGQLTSDRVAISGSAAQVVGLAWDAEGNLTQTHYPGGRVVDQHYDALNRKDGISEGGSAIASYTYLGPFALTETKVLGSGVGVGYAYDAHERVSQITYRVGSPFTGTPNAGTSLEWDAANNKTARTDVLTGVRHDYAYDSLSRLAQSVRSGSAANRTMSYSLDGVGNRISVTGGPASSVYVMNSATPTPADREMNQYTQCTVDPEFDEGAKQQAYDDNGNLKSLTEIYPSVGTLKQVWYDYRNHMVQLQQSTGQPKHKYVYDAFGRLVSIIKNATTSPVETRLFYVKFHVIEEQTSSASTLASYVWGQHVDEVLQMKRGASTYYYETDDLNNVVCITNGSGSIVESYEYSDYGRILNPATFQSIDATTSVNVYFWQGARLDGLSKWYYERSRFLMPGKGRFTTRDELGIWGDQGNLGNGYTFTGNNPWSRTDPTGEGWLGALVGGAIGAVTGFVNAVSDGSDIGNIVGGTLKGAVGGALVGSAAEGAVHGALIGAVGGAIVGTVKAILNGTDVEEGFTRGAITGAETGAIVGAVAEGGGIASAMVGSALGSGDEAVSDLVNDGAISGDTIGHLAASMLEGAAGHWAGGNLLLGQETGGTVAAAELGQEVAGGLAEGTADGLGGAISSLPGHETGSSDADGSDGDGGCNDS